jgi:sulfide:quinone oxidoreductase
VIIGVLSTPFKCPPAPSETALLLHDKLVKRGLRERSEISLVMDFGRPIPPSPAASELLEGVFAERGIAWHRGERCASSIHRRRSRRCATAASCHSTCSSPSRSIVPQRSYSNRRWPVNGWIPVNPLTLETTFDGVYAVGDVAAVGTPRAGVFAEGQAAVAAEHIAARIKGTTSDAEYGGRGVCYLEVGDGQIALVDVTFFGDRRVGQLVGPSEAYMQDKIEFGSSRIKRWFGRDWKET